MLMYILLAMTATAVEPYSTCDRNRINAAQGVFNDLSNRIIDLDKKIQDTCKQFPTFAAQEVFGTNGYRLEILLPEFSSAEFVVQIKHRVVYINGHYPRHAPACDLTYVDIKVIPEFVNHRGGAWTYKDGVLVIAFPYARHLEEFEPEYNTYIDETMIHLRRGFPSEQIFN